MPLLTDRGLSVVNDIPVLEKGSGQEGAGEGGPLPALARARVVMEIGADPAATAAPSPPLPLPLRKRGLLEGEEAQAVPAPPPPLLDALDGVLGLDLDDIYPGTSSPKWQGAGGRGRVAGG